MSEGGSGRSAKAIRTRMSILDAARNVFSQHGFDAALTSEVARVANCAEGTVFLHFKNKRGLLLALMKDFYRQLQDSSEIILGTDLPADKQLLQLTQLYVGELETHWSVVKLFGSRARLTEDDFSDAFYRMNRRFTRLFVDVFERLKTEGLFRADADPRRLRDMLFGAIEHFALTYFGRSQRGDVEGFIDQTLSLLFYGAACRQQEDSTQQKLDQILTLLQAAD